MPWPEKQREAIFLNTQREKGTKAAEETMQEAGYGDAKKTVYAGRKRPKKRHKKHKRQHAKPEQVDAKTDTKAIARKKLGKARFQKLAQKAR